jgi:aryl-alcohol dehydrogenase-like predicted oxidoreductase
MTFGTDKPTWGGFPAISVDDSFSLINRYDEVGGNFFDTANVYTGGQSEEILGSWLEVKGNREKYVVATKCGYGIGPEVNGHGTSRRAIIQNLEASLERLRTPYIDLFQMHTFDFNTEQRETLNTLNDLIRCGKIRYIGCSNYNGSQLQYALLYAEMMGIESYISLQPQYSLLSRSIEMELVPVCEDNKVAILPWSPLKGGWLTGKYRRGQMPTEGRVAWAEKVGWVQTGFTKWDNDTTWEVIETVDSIAQSIGATMAQVALRWVMQKSYITSTIIGARTVAQLDDNIGAAKIQLSPEHMMQLDQISKLNFPYPYDQQTERRAAAKKR